MEINNCLERVLQHLEVALQSEQASIPIERTVLLQCLIDLRAVKAYWLWQDFERMLCRRKLQRLRQRVEWLFREERRV
jgi:hypothetical protein